MADVAKKPIQSLRGNTTIMYTIVVLLLMLMLCRYFKKEYQGNGRTTQNMTTVNAPLPVCSDATTVELGPYRREAAIVVREECMSSLIVRTDPKKYDLKINFQGQEGNVDMYIFRDRKTYVGTLSQLRVKDKTWNIDAERDSIRLAGYNGTATARLR